MADGNIVNHPWGAMMSRLDAIAQNYSNTHSSLSFNASALVQNQLSYAGSWHLYTYYTDHSTGGGGITNQWAPARIDTGQNGWQYVNTIGSGLLNFVRRSTAYNVYIEAAFVTPWGRSLAGQYISIAALPTPSSPTNCTHTRNDDNKNTVSWVNAGSNPRSNSLIERSVDGGGFSQIASVSAQASSYVDSTTQPDHSYSYRIRSVFTANGYNMQSGYSNNSTVTYNTPATPKELSASRNSDDSATVSFINESLIATGLDYQRSNNGVDWSVAVSVAGEGITSITDSPGGGVWYFRVRNTRGELASEWSAPSNSIVTIIAPAAPTLTSPLNGSVVNKAITPTRLTWSHNPIDSSSQQAAQLRLSSDGSTWTDPIEIDGGVNYYDHPTSWPVNAQVLWQARTKGAHEDFGAWSSSASFTVRQVPQVAITSPASDDEVIKAMPIVVAWNYADQSGSQLSATIRLLDKNNKQLWSHTLTGSDTSYAIRAADVFPENKNTYTITVTVASTSTLTAQTSRRFVTDYQEPAMPQGLVDVDYGAASVSLVVAQGTPQDDEPPAIAFSIVRVHADGRQVVLAEEVESGTAATDFYCPIAQKVKYLFLAHAETGAVSRFEVPVQIASELGCWINFGKKVCVVKLGVSHDRQTEHDVELFNTAGDEDPMAFYGRAKQATGSITGLAIRHYNEDLSWAPITIADFNELADYTGAVIVRLPYWDAFTANVTVAQEANRRHLEQVTIDWTRVRNHGVATL